MSERPDELALLLDAVSPANLAATLARLPAETRHKLMRRAASRHPALVSWALAHGTRDELRTLAANPRLSRAQLEQLVEFAERTGHSDGGLSVMLYRHRNANPAIRRRLLASASTPRELLEEFWGIRRSLALLGPALDCPIPKLAKCAAALLMGPRGVRRPANTPRALYEWFQGTTYTSPNSRALLRGRLALFRTDRWTPSDWAELAALHEARPLDPASCVVLVELPECPRDVALALIRDDSDDDVRGDTIHHGLFNGTFTAEDVVRRAPHAPYVLRALEAHERFHDPVAHPFELPALHRELRSLVRDSLGGDPTVWRTLLAHLADDFPGTLPELAAAAHTLPAPAYRQRPWPHVQQVSTSPFIHLLRFADPGAWSGIFGALDPHDLGEIAHYDIQKPLPDALVDAFLAHAGRDVAEVFMPHHAYHDTTRARVLRRDDPGLNAALLRGSDVPRRTWYEIAAGTPHGRDGRVPLHPEVRASLSGEGSARPSGGSAIRFAVHTRDADLVLNALRRPLTTAHQIIGCRLLAELGRTSELAELAHRHGPLDPLVGTAIRRTLTARGPRALAARLAVLDRAQAVHDLQYGNPESVHAQLERDAPPPWDDLRSLILAGRISVRTREVIAEHPDLPDLVAAALLDIDDGSTSVPLVLAPRSRAWALIALARLPVVPSWMDSGLHPSLLWTARCLETGVIGAEDVWALGRPAHAVLRLMGAYPIELGILRERVADEIARLGADTPDSWAVTSALLGEFTGTLSELLTTVTAAISPIAPHAPRN